MKGWMVLVLVPLITGCAPANRWTRSDAPPNQADRDWAQCRRAADREVLGRSPRSYDADIGIAAGPDSGRGNPLAMASRQQDEKAHERAVGSCMTGLGYRLTPTK
ncbi:MAG: hypothetical protein H7840_08780 [Alphaproteobacteria bacterium]